MNTTKIIGLAICVFGVLLTRSEKFFTLGGSLEFALTALGIAVSFIGLAVFASGMKKRIEKKIRVCGNCFYKNDASATQCSKCRHALPRREP
jgi:ribosomal protein L40E